MIPRVKICGVTRGEDAVLAAGLGASAIGFVLWPNSPRYVPPSRVRAIVADLPPFVTVVGAFVDQPPEGVAEIATEAGLTAIQLHGREDARTFRHLPWPIIKAVAIRRGVRPAELLDVPVGVPVVYDPLLGFGWNVVACAFHAGCGRRIAGEGAHCERTVRRSASVWHGSNPRVDLIGQKRAATSRQRLLAARPTAGCQRPAR